MQHMAALHKLDADSLCLEALPRPKSSEGLALDQLESIEATYRASPAAQHPLVDFGLNWLARHAPRSVPDLSLVHGDIGPGNMIYADGRVRALIDWEIAHLGDPMEDLAALSVRDMATPVGDFSTRLEQYAAAGGAQVDLARLRYYRALVLIRNSLLIQLTLAGSSPDGIPPQLRAFSLLLRRAATQALREATGVGSLETQSRATALLAAPLHDEETWIRSLSSRANAECISNHDLMGPLFDRHLQPVPLA
jgi:aminoglycoside phosphotransferase (APT) family kinase protein